MIPSFHQLVAAGIKPERADSWLKPVQDACLEFGIDTHARIAGFIGQCAHETGGFAVLEENLNYSADTMAAVWPNRFAVLGPDKRPVKVNGKSQPNKFALALHRKPEAIANVVYSNRMGNGSIESGEGWLYRGRGLKQLTGKDNVIRCSKALGVDFVNNPDLLFQPTYAACSAAWFWKTNNLSAFADIGDIVGMTKKVNGGLIGIEDRKKRCSAVLACVA
jgi:putative chitinase